jgi:hypothetical protein
MRRSTGCSCVQPITRANSWLVYGCGEPSSFPTCAEVWPPMPALVTDNEDCGVYFTNAVMLYPRSLRLLYLVLHPISCSLAHARRGKEHRPPTFPLSTCRFSFERTGGVLYRLQPTDGRHAPFRIAARSHPSSSALFTPVCRRSAVCLSLRPSQSPWVCLVLPRIRGTPHLMNS